MIELHKGRVEAKSEVVGMGSEFVVRLPVLDAVQDGPLAPQRPRLPAKLRAGGFCPPSLKLVAVTGYAKDAEALAAAGFDDHLTKPVDFEQLGETLANVIAAMREPRGP